MNTNLKTKVQSDGERIEGLSFEPRSTQAAHDQGASAGERSRTLDDLEEFFWFSQNANPFLALFEMRKLSRLGEENAAAQQIKRWWRPFSTMT
jgi:hypothetical protein